MTIHVVTHAWHAGIVVRATDVPPGRWPQRHDFPRAEYLEVGWGDREYWQASEPTSGQALSALFRPTPSVLRVIGFRGPPEAFFLQGDVIALELSQPGFERLVAFVEAAYAADERGAPIPVGPGPIAESRFYAARDQYHLLRTSNRWTAEALRTAGLPITPAWAFTAGNVVRQVSRVGRVIRTRE